MITVLPQRTHVRQEKYHEIDNVWPALAAAHGGKRGERETGGIGLGKKAERKEESEKQEERSSSEVVAETKRSKSFCGQQAACYELLQFDLARPVFVLKEEDQRKRDMEAANKQEDKTIKQLEKKLGLNKRKSRSLPQGFVNDGLADILLCARGFCVTVCLL